LAVADPAHMTIETTIASKMYMSFTIYLPEPDMIKVTARISSANPVYR
jgi:hypothetical protein